MKFKLAFRYRGLCETETIDASYENYKELGRKHLEGFGLDREPDFFIQQRGRWWKLDELGEICGQEFCAADYSE